MIVLFWILRERSGGDIFGLGLILGGALGNILDRVQYGYVVDYADLHFGTFRPFLIFNIADAAIHHETKRSVRNVRLLAEGKGAFRPRIVAPDITF